MNSVARNSNGVRNPNQLRLRMVRHKINIQALAHFFATGKVGDLCDDAGQGIFGGPSSYCWGLN
jgi:hypothetical protein